jgi:phosphoribosylaminoimidazole-succinocarboxamide synthase
MFNFNKQTNFYSGKVRDVYSIGDSHLIMVASNRISAFDVILPTPIPYKGQVLTQIAAHFLQATKHIVPNWFINSLGPNVSAGLRAKPFAIEMVIRGCLSGHAWRTYKSGNRVLCGVTMPDGLKENDYFPTPIITPTTKAAQGHDEDISKEDIISKGIVSLQDYEALENITQALFAKGREMAQAQGLILVDTKYEFGKIGETIYLIDEIHTPDSSRYFYADTYKQLQAENKPQRQLSKEFVREWLIANNFQGKEGQQIPEITQEFATVISERYIELYEKVVGTSFVKQNIDDAAILAEANKWIDSI